ncbi:MAG: alpha/beta hydrolase [Candidatus Heimdallarchaeota archaeon]|nr:alpha/beta hydrolase [Candidatus Heimdallarchaeota archaeon]
MVNSNILPFRLFNQYQLQIPAKLHYLSEPKLAYWKYIQSDKSKNVILLHGITRNSGKMNSRAKIYKKLGYNIYLIDNLGHGKSKYIPFPSGFGYHKQVLRVIQAENIENPILHGVSMGAIASSYLAQKQPNQCKMIICEALPYSFDNLYQNMLNYMHISYKHFPWLDYLSKKIVWPQFIDQDIQYRPASVSCPFYYINGEKDPMFKPETHFPKFQQKLNGSTTFQSWIVPDAKHSNMDNHQEYEHRLIQFLERWQ